MSLLRSILLDFLIDNFFSINEYFLPLFLQRTNSNLQRTGRLAAAERGDSAPAPPGRQIESSRYGGRARDTAETTERQDTLRHNYNVLLPKSILLVDQKLISFDRRESGRFSMRDGPPLQRKKRARCCQSRQLSCMSHSCSEETSDPKILQRLCNFRGFFPDFFCVSRKVSDAPVHTTFLRPPVINLWCPCFFLLSISRDRLRG